MIASHAQVQIELNSTTDNPLIDVVGKAIHHGGNFQAMAVTNAMEKTRLGVQQMGKMNYAQMTELVKCVHAGLLLRTSLMTLLQLLDEPRTSFVPSC